MPETTFFLGIFRRRKPYMWEGEFRSLRLVKLLRKQKMKKIKYLELIESDAYSDKHTAEHWGKDARADRNNKIVVSWEL